MKLLITYNLTQYQLEEVRSLLRHCPVILSREKEEALREARDADIAFLGAFTREVLEEGLKLRWAHIPWAGVDRFLDVIRRSPAVVTCGKGIFDAAMADHVFALLLSITRGINLCVEDKMGRRWRRAELGLTDLRGKTMGIVGLGSVGREVARRARAFGMYVMGVKRLPSSLSEEPVDGLFIGYEGLRAMLPDCDVLVITAALTPETYHLIGEVELESLRDGAILINVARGAIVDEEALVNALRSGKLAGAGIDVFEREPLPPDSPLWELRNVVLTPHIGGISDKTHLRIFERFMENLRRFLSGEPLLGVVDKRAGY
jgi:phosphoglycerate dehydrogenase-like enzyme